MAKEIVKLLPGPGRENGYIQVVIEDNGQESTIADLAGFAVLGLLVPALISCELTFYVRHISTGTFQLLKRNVLSDDSMESVKLEVGTGNQAISSVSLECLKGYRFVKIKASAGQTSGPVTFTWIVKG